MNPVSEGINYLMSNTLVRITTVLFINRFLGATLNPMPVFLTKLLSSWIFKYICLVLVGIVAKHPLVDGAMTEVFIAAAIVLGVTFVAYEVIVRYNLNINIGNPFRYLCRTQPTKVKKSPKSPKSRKSRKSRKSPKLFRSFRSPRSTQTDSESDF